MPLRKAENVLVTVQASVGWTFVGNADKLEAIGDRNSRLMLDFAKDINLGHLTELLEKRRINAWGTLMGFEVEAKGFDALEQEG